MAFFSSYCAAIVKIGDSTQEIVKPAEETNSSLLQMYPSIR